MAGPQLGLHVAARGRKVPAAGRESASKQRDEVLGDSQQLLGVKVARIGPGRFLHPLGAARFKRQTPPDRRNPRAPDPGRRQTASDAVRGSTAPRHVVTRRLGHHGDHGLPAVQFDQFRGSSWPGSSPARRVHRQAGAKASGPGPSTTTPCPRSITWRSAICDHTALTRRSCRPRCGRALPGPSALLELAAAWPGQHTATPTPSGPPAGTVQRRGVRLQPAPRLRQLLRQHRLIVEAGQTRSATKRRSARADPRWARGTRDWPGCRALLHQQLADLQQPSRH